jgi:hypothetical protein
VRKTARYFFIFLVFFATFLVAFAVFFAFFAFLAMSSSWFDWLDECADAVSRCARHQANMKLAKLIPRWVNALVEVLRPRR